MAENQNNVNNVTEKEDKGILSGIRNGVSKAWDFTRPARAWVTETAAMAAAGAITGAATVGGMLWLISKYGTTDNLDLTVTRADDESGVEDSEED